MSHLIDRKLVVRCSDDTPRALFWKGRWHPVADIVEVWRDTGEWWQGEAEKAFYRLRLSRGAILEVYEVKNQWFLYRLYD